jgi:DNA modification methylase
MSVEILVGDCRDVLKTLPAQSVQMVCTSPPYFGLRDYETATWDGGDPTCDHIVGTTRIGLADSPASTRGGAKKAAAGTPFQARETCPRCGARRVDHQIGLEPTPDEFVLALVEVFREIKRVLRDDGTVWINLGDSYSGSRSGPDSGSTLQGTRHSQNQAKRAREMTSSRRRDNQAVPRSDVKIAGIKPKNLIGIPWRVALALQADGWVLRQDIIWSKPNPMPESVLDRCTKSHEHFFMLTKSSSPTIWRARDTEEWSDAPNLKERIADPTEDKPDRTVPRWREFDYYYDAGAIAEAAFYPPGGTHDDVPQGGFNDKGVIPGSNQRAFRAIRETRNKRDVWTVSTAPFGQAHFATYPPALIEPAILAGSPEGAMILDPFGGAGTTGLVADRLRRRCILIELNPGYAAMASRRLGMDAGLFAQVSVA